MQLERGTEDVGRLMEVKDDLSKGQCDLGFEVRVVSAYGYEAFTVG